MDKIEIGVARAHMLDLLSQATAEFEKPDTVPAGSAEFEFEARDNNSGDPIIVRFSNDDMEREDVTNEVYVEVNFSGE